MAYIFSTWHRPLAAGIGVGLLAACSAGPDLSGVAAENTRALKRYDIVQAIATNDKVVVAGTQSGVVLVSADEGKTWTRSALGNTSLVDIASCGKQGFIAIDHYHKVWSSDAEGRNWQSTKLEQPGTPLAATCDPQGGWWVVGSNATIVGSKDQGKTWQVTDLKTDKQITTIQFIDDQRAVALGEFGLSVYSTDAGASWTQGAKLPGEFYPYAALFANANEGWVSGIAGQMLVTRDGGKTWNKQPNAAGVSLYRLFLNGGVPFGVGAGGVIARLDKETWRNVPYTDPLPVFLGAGAALPGQSAVVVGGPGGLLRAVATASKQ